MAEESTFFSSKKKGKFILKVGRGNSPLSSNTHIKESPEMSSLEELVFT